MSKNKGKARMAAILELLLPHAKGVVVDVGCDHGLVARALQEQTDAIVIASERMEHRLPRKRHGLRLLVADGMAPLKHVDACVIAGMGPYTILRILSQAPTPTTAVVHSPDRTDSLRQGLKDAGWRIVEERLAPENGRFAEVLRVVRGAEHAEGHRLWMGPRLLETGHPHLAAHVELVRAHWAHVAKSAPAGTQGHHRAQGWLEFIETLPG